MKMTQLLTTGLVVAASILVDIDSLSAQEGNDQKPVEQVLGTWVKTAVTIDGKQSVHKLLIESVGSEGEFHFEYRTTPVGSKESAISEGNGVLVSGGRQYVVMDVNRTRRVLPKEEKTDWRTTPFSVVAQIVGDHMYSAPGLDSKGGVWKREDSTESIVTADKLKVLAPLLGTYQGDHKFDVESKSYGVKSGTHHVVCRHTLTESGKLILGEWTETPVNGSAEDAMEVRAVYSYSPAEKTVIISYQSSTGVSMTGKVVAMSEDKILWERKGQSPAGAVHEYCLLDFSQPGVLRHVITSRTVNGIPAEGEEGVTITLKKQE